MGQIKLEYNTDIIYATRTGEVNVHDLLEYVKNIDANYSNQSNIYILDDVTASSSILEPPYDFSNIIDEIKQRISRYKSVSLAVYVEDPTDTAFSILFDSLISYVKGFSFQTFSTKESAMEWLILKQAQDQNQ
jgi:hypothetical protein